MKTQTVHWLPLAVLAVAVVAVGHSPAVQADPTKAPPASENAEPSVDPARLARDAALRADDARNRAVSASNLEQIAKAVHDHNDAILCLPADVVGKDGKPLLSWRVALLPSLKQEALYKQFKLDEPWDSKHNLKLLEKMPEVLRSPRVRLKGKGYTVYQGFAGDDAAFRPRRPRSIPADFPDGTSNTIVVVESSTAVPWTRPADLPFDPKKNVPDFGKAFGQQPLAGLADGSARLLDLKKLSTATLKRAINPADFMPIGDDW